MTKQRSIAGVSRDVLLRLIRIRKNMIERCYRPKAANYQYYGARGIGVCTEWQASVEAFVMWAVTNGYASGLQLDRRDPGGDYSPSNCRWATSSQNNANRRKQSMATSGFKGVCRRRDRWGAYIGDRRIGAFATAEDAARAYDAAALSLYGEFAQLNFPSEKPSARNGLAEARQ